MLPRDRLCLLVECSNPIPWSQLYHYSMKTHPIIAVFNAFKVDIWCRPQQPPIIDGSHQTLHKYRKWSESNSRVDRPSAHVGSVPWSSTGPSCPTALPRHYSKKTAQSSCSTLKMSNNFQNSIEINALPTVCLLRLQENLAVTFSHLIIPPLLEAAPLEPGILEFLVSWLYVSFLTLKFLFRLFPYLPRTSGPRFCLPDLLKCPPVPK